MPRKEKITVDISAKNNVKKPLSETAKLRVQLGKVIKLNEELTAENSRLLTELASIKSKWWYKLMTWVW